MRRCFLLVLVSSLATLIACDQPVEFDWSDPEAVQISITSPGAEVYTRDGVSFQIVVSREVDKLELLRVEMFSRLFWIRIDRVERQVADHDAPPIRSVCPEPDTPELNRTPAPTVWPALYAP